MCFNPTSNISTLNGSSVKLVDKFTYLGSTVSSTEKDIDTRQHHTKQQIYGHQQSITKTIKIWRTRHAGHCWRSRDELTSDVLLWALHMDEQKQVDQLEPTYSSSVPIRDVALRTCRKEWTVGRGGERGSGISVLIARHDDGDDVYTVKWFHVQSMINFFII